MIRFHCLASANIRIRDERLFMELRILNWRKQFDLLSSTYKNKPPSKKKIQSKKTNKPAISWKRIKHVLMSFRINTCYITIDTGNVQLNALLFPIAYWIHTKSKKNISINFIGKNDITLEIQNNLARMSWAYLSS